MKLLKKANRIDVKRTFLITHFLRKHGVARKQDKYTPTKIKYLKALKKARKAVNKLDEKHLDKHISKYKKRLRSYNKVEWYIGEVSIKEVGVWKIAGNLPRAWTDNSLAYTAKLVKNGLKENDKKMKGRSGRVIPIIISLKSIIKKDKYSLPIIIERKQSPVNRRGLKKMPWELDDGNMRAISFAVSGDKKIKAYIGVTKK